MIPGRRNLSRGHRALAVAVAAALAVPSVAGAFEFVTGNEDLSIRFDNTVRVNVTGRVASQDEAILGNVNFDDGDRNFDDGALFERVDVLTEFDFVWKRSAGFRVSAASWWDGGYQSLDGDSLATSNSLEDGLPTLDLDPHAERYAKGPSAELLDAFAFAKFDIGETPVNVKLGQTTVFWGESLLLGGAIHGVSYSQNPLDVWKGLATPGAEAKELFRPRLGFNVQAQVADDVSVAAQYFFNWQSFENQAYRYPEAGTYLSVGDMLLWGGNSLIAGPNPLAAMVPGAPAYLRLWRGKDIEPEENSGNYGLALRWSPQWLDGTLGAYYRRTYDMQPQLMVTPGLAASLPKAVCESIGGISLAPPAAPPATAAPCIINTDATNPGDLMQKGRAGQYNLAFGEDVEIYGLSLSKNVAGISVGAELSYRENMPLLSDPVTVVPGALLAAPTTPSGAIATSDVPKSGTPGAVGTTMHGVVNLLGLIGQTPLFDTASWSTEFTWMQWLDVDRNEGVFKGRRGYDLIDAVDKNYFGVAVNLTPTWFQVLPSLDLMAPISWSQGFANSAVTSGGQDGAGTFAIGIAADFRQKYRFDLKYVGFYGDYAKAPDGSVAVFNGTSAVLGDRDFVSLTFKTSF
jgi:hypothetical protein